MKALTPKDIRDLVATVWQLRNESEACGQKITIGEAVATACDRAKLDTEWRDVVWACLYM